MLAPSEGSARSQGEVDLGFGLLEEILQTRSRRGYDAVVVAQMFVLGGETC